MFPNNLSVNTPAVQGERNNLKNIYYKFQSFLGRGTESPCNRQTEDMLSARGSTTTSEDSFITPVSSVDDLMALSPNRTIDTRDENPDMTSDLLTGNEFDSICDVTMKEVPIYDNFIDANSLDYLVKCAESHHNHNLVDRGKESLFVKFDPLYARQECSTHTESVADSVEYDIGYETGSAASVVTDNHASSPKHVTSGPTLMSSKEKPTQVVPPVINDLPKLATHARSTPVLIRSVSAILTPTQVTTERLISFAGSTPPTAAPRSQHFNHSSSHTQSDRLRNILQKQDQEIFQLAQENRGLRSSLQEMEHKYTRTMSELETKIKKLTEEKENLLERECKLIQQVNDKILSYKQMSIVMEEYEKTISSLIGEQQHDRKNFLEIQESIISEKEQALNHLSSMESSFNDLLSKYEKCKSLILETKEREKIFEHKISEYEIGLKKYEKLYNNLKDVTSESLSKANESLESTKKSHSVEIMKLNATIKKHEINIASLQESLVQKTRDNEELTRICDQLINEVR